MKKIEKKIGLYIQMNKEEKDIVEILKTKYSINISQMIKNNLREVFGRLENEEKTNRQK